MTAQRTYWRDIRWQASGNALAQLVGILGMPLLTRLYMPADFATQSLFAQGAMFLAGLVTMRLEYFIQLPDSHADALRMLSFIGLIGLLLAAAFSLGLWCLREPIAQLASSTSLAPWLVLVPWAALAISLSVALQHFAQRNQDYRSSGLAELSGKVGYVGVAALLAPAGHGIGLILSIAAGAASKGLHLWLGSVRRQLHEQLAGSLRTDLAAGARMAHRYSRLSGSLVGSHMLATVTGAAPLLYLSHAYGSDPLGQFALVMSTIFLPASLLGAAVGQVYYQRAAADWAAGRTIHGLWKSTLDKLCRYGLPTYLGIALISPWAYPWIFGGQWQASGELARYLAISGFFSLISSPMDRTCLIVGAWRYPLLWHTGRMVTTLLVIVWAHVTAQPLTNFVQALVAQMASLYIVDLFANRHFARRVPTPFRTDGQHAQS